MSTNSKIKHVFVLMLENHSHDVMLSQRLPNTPAVGSNTYQGITYKADSPAPLTLTADPGHELYDTLLQMTHINGFPPNPAPNLKPYPRAQFPADFANGTAFVESYATTTDENTPKPQPANYGDTLKCFGPDQLPVLHTLAGSFCVCNNWFSSLPGPTWPNRFFLHLASSNGMDCSPTNEQLADWLFPSDYGFKSNKGSIFQALEKAGLKYSIYNDCDPAWDPLSANFHGSNFADNPSLSRYTTGGGWVPQVGSLHGIHYDSWSSLYGHFAKDLSNNYTSQYTFIEPHYGDLTSDTYRGGSSQHPMDDVYGGENLLKFVYETLRSSPIWNESLLIVTYDEHGGFYDSVAPPAAIPPGDGIFPGTKLNKYGFQFDQLGLRVPAILISPLIPAGKLDDTQYDHTSVIATLAALFGTPSHPLQLTNRDKQANNVLSNITLTTPRTDCPVTLPSPVASQVTRPGLSATEIAANDQKPLPQSGNLIGTMGILLKIHREVSSKDPITQYLVKRRFKKVKTYGDLKVYAHEVAIKCNKKKTGRKYEVRRRK